MNMQFDGRKCNIKALITVVFVFLMFQAFSQNEFYEFGQKSLKTQTTGMYVLGSWAVLNMATGAYGWSKYEGDQMYFHQMNFFWNVVNLSIAGFAIYNNANTDVYALSNESILADHISIERLLLINAGLDIGYMATGYFLTQRSKKITKQADLLKGYGNSIMLQGAFLFGFDLVLWGILRSDRLEFLQGVNIGALPNGFQVQYVMNF